VTEDGQRIRGVAVFVGNGRYYGGTFRLFPTAKFDDGLLDVCVFPSTRYLDLCRYGFGILRAAHHRLRDVRYFQAASFRCEPANGETVAFEVDGEDAGSGPVTFSVARGALRLICP
jgi:diacylglycerol kinase family enzyme